MDKRGLLWYDGSQRKSAGMAAGASGSCRASFYYFDLNENHEKVYRKDRQLYVVDPIALVFAEDNYYLMCWSEKYQQIVSYRVARVKVQVSPTFWGWVFRFRGELQITEPQELIDTYKSLLEGACEKTANA